MFIFYCLLSSYNKELESRWQNSYILTKVQFIFLHVVNMLLKFGLKMIRKSFYIFTHSTPFRWVNVLLFLSLPLSEVFCCTIFKVFYIKYNKDKHFAGLVTKNSSNISTFSFSFIKHNLYILINNKIDWLIKCLFFY